MEACTAFVHISKPHRQPRRDSSPAGLRKACNQSFPLKHQGQEACKGLPLMIPQGSLTVHESAGKPMVQHYTLTECSLSR